MKLLIFIAISSLFFVNGGLGVHLPLRGFPVTKMQLRSDEPIENNVNAVTSVEIRESTGSIGARTLSSFPNLGWLSITNSNITHVEDGSLCTPKLLSIEISSNENFPVLTKSLLRNCDNIRILNLKNVRMEPDAFEHMEKLTAIEFRNQKGLRISKDYLKPLKSLQRVGFNYCEIDDIDTGALCQSPALKEIHMYGSTIRQRLRYSMFENCNNIVELDLIHNQLEGLEEGAFKDFKNLDYAYLENLNIEHLTKNHLVGLTNAVTLLLDNSKISTIDSDAFTGFNRLVQLYMKGNRLTEFKLDVDLDRLSSISFNNNELTEISSDTISHLPKLGRLYLKNNKLTSIDDLSHPKLKLLHVNGNSIMQIDTESVKKNLPKLETLNVGNNPLNPDDLNGLKNDLEGIEIQ